MQELKEIAVKDKVVQSVLNKIATRSIIGQQKYGTTLAENDLPLIDWLNHLQEELMDAINYIERIKQEINSDIAE